MENQDIFVVVVVVVVIVQIWFIWSIQDKKQRYLGFFFCPFVLLRTQL